MMRSSAGRVLRSASAAIISRPAVTRSQVLSTVAGYAHMSQPQPIGDGESVTDSSDDRSSAADHVSCFASTVICKQIKGSHVLRIQGYSLLSKMKRRRVDSPAFDVGGHSWCVQLYPHGEHDDDDDDDDEEEEETEYGAGESEFDHVSVYLQRLDSSPNGEPILFARFRFSILDQLGNPRGAVCAGWCNFDDKDNEWGERDWISRKELGKPEYLKDDSLAVRCDIDVATVTEASISMKEVEKPECFEDDSFAVQCDVDVATVTEAST